MSEAKKRTVISWFLLVLSGHVSPRGVAID